MITASKSTSFQALLRLSGGRCWYCGRTLDQSNWSRDHVVARANGGQTKGNVVPACVPCNHAKGAKSVETFRANLTRQKYQMPHFNEKQRKWLRERGFPIDTFQPHTFWYEEIGLELPWLSKELIAVQSNRPEATK